MTERIRFKSKLSWINFLNSKTTQNEIVDLSDYYKYRVACYNDIQLLRRRPLLVYAANFEASKFGAPISIELSDIDGFIDLTNSIDNVEEVDILLHSPGGSPDVTERIVNILRNKFKRVHFLIPHSAYSAATMLALSGNTITLHPGAILGPIDPQINGIPAKSILKGFESVKEKLKIEGPESLPAYIPLLEKYSLPLLEICRDSEQLSKILATEWIENYMFNPGEIEKTKIDSIVEFFLDYNNHLIHSRPLFYDKIKDLGLKIEQSNKELSDLLWEAYILIDVLFNVTQFYKLYENTDNFSFGRQYQISAPITQSV